MVAALVAGLALLQNPYPPDVTVPKDWQVKYWESSFGRGALISPQGFEIAYPDYTPSGQVAYVQYEMNVKTVFITAVVERARIQATISPDGLVAVSYPDDPAAGYKAKGWPFDYWSRPKGARQVALALLIPLTRLDHHPVDADNLSATKNMYPPSAAEPFMLMQVTGSRHSVERTPSSLTLNGSAVQLSGEVPSKVRWTESTPLLGGDLAVSEDLEGKTWVRFAPVGKKPVVFSGAGHDTPTIAIAVFAALVYFSG